MKQLSLQVRGLILRNEFYGLIKYWRFEAKRFSKGWIST
jgi:hypothetical protein